MILKEKVNLQFQAKGQNLLKNEKRMNFLKIKEEKRQKSQRV